MADEKKIIEISVNNDAAIQEIIRLREETAKLKDTEGLTKEQIEANRIATQEYNQQIRSLQGEVKNSIRTDREKQGSLNQMKAEIANLTKEYNSLSKEEREGAKGVELRDKIKNMTDELKANESAIGDNRRQVGGYQEDIEKAMKSVGGMPGPLGAMAKSTQGVTMAAKAFIATPLGAVVAALSAAIGALTAYFKGSEEGANDLAKITTVLSSIWGNFSDLIQKAGKYIFDAISNPQQAIKDFGQLLKEQITNRVTGMLELFPALGNAISLAFKGNFKEAGTVAVNALGKVALGVDDVTGKVGAAVDGIKELTKEMQAEAKIAVNVANMRARADKIERDLIVSRARDEAKIAELRLKARQDEKFSAEERMAFIVEAGKLTDDLGMKERNLAALRYEATRIENTLSNTTKEGLKEEAEMKAAVFNADARRDQALKGMLRDKDRIENELKNASIAREKEKQAELLAIKKAADDELNTLFEESEKEMALLEDFEQERIKTKLQIENDSRFELKRQQYDNEFDLLRIELEKQYAQQIEAAEKVGADTTNITALYERAKTEIQDEETSARLDLVAGLAGDIAQLFGEGTVVGKMAASAQTAINTYQAAMGAYANATPLLGPIGGAIAAGIATAAGIKAIKNIWAVKSGLPSDSNSASSSVRLTSVAPATPDTTARIASPLTPIISPTGSAAITSGAATSISTGAADPLRIMQNMPAPIVTVKDIDIAQKRVKVTDSLAKI